MTEYTEDKYINEKIFQYFDRSTICIENIYSGSSCILVKQKEENNGLIIASFLVQDYFKKIESIIYMIDNLRYNFNPTNKLRYILLRYLHLMV